MEATEKNKLDGGNEAIESNTLYKDVKRGNNITLLRVNTDASQKHKRVTQNVQSGGTKVSAAWPNAPWNACGCHVPNTWGWHGLKK